MSYGKRSQHLLDSLTARFGDDVVVVPSRCGDVHVEVSAGQLLRIATALRDEPPFSFDTLIDVCGVDYLTYGQGEWQTQESTGTGFSRAQSASAVLADPDAPFPPRRFAVVYHLLSVACNHRLRVTVHTGPANPPVVPSVTGIWAGADWFEREAFDLYGILFEGHADLRRLLTDYGFIGHPFRKDFPLSGNLEVLYDPAQGRVVYQPVSIEPRTLVPRVIRDDNRYDADLRDRS